MADPLSVLGAAVGVTALIMQTMDECIKGKFGSFFTINPLTVLLGYRYYIRAMNMPDEYRYCKVRLQMEQQRFLNFGLESGILYADGAICATLRVNKSLLLAVLAEIKSLFEQYAAVNAKYVHHIPQAKVDDPEEPETDLTAILCQPLDKTTHAISSDSNQRKPQRLEQLRKAAKGIIQTGRNVRTIALEPKRLVWVAVDKDSFESLIARLADLNSFLIALLDSVQIERLQFTMDTSYNEILQIRNDIRSLTGLVKALSNETGERNDKLLGATTLDTSILEQLFSQQADAQKKRNSYLKKLTEVKIQYKYIGDQMGAETVMSAREPLNLSYFDLNKHHDDGFPGNHTHSTYQGRHVWIDWKIYPFNQLMADTATFRAEDRIRLLVDLLCNEIPEGFRSLPCLGYVKSVDKDDEARFGIVFEKPSGIPSAQVMTLHRLLQHLPKPSLSTRITLCADLAECIHTFHTVNWLHKGLRSENVIFFSPQPDYPVLNAPYVLGYELSRPTVLDELTEKPTFNPYEDIYRHPFAQSSHSSGNYRKSYDLYSLAILLIEIASWKPIPDFLGFADLASTRPSDLLAVQRRLLEDGVHLQHMTSTLGDAYKEIVELCLRADEIERPIYDGECGASIAVRLQRTLHQNIVRKLRDMETVLNLSL